MELQYNRGLQLKKNCEMKTCCKEEYLEKPKVKIGDKIRKLKDLEASNICSYNKH